MVKPYYDYASFLRRRYGGRVGRVPLDLGLGCPHRDPETLEGGCTYCGSTGSRAVFLRRGMSIEEQVEIGMDFARRRYRSARFLAYFQAFTSTHAPASVLRDLYYRALNAGDFCGVIVSTRPDCLPAETVDLLAELAEHWDCWVELGIQTVHDETLKRVRRGHDFACSRRAVRRLHARGIHTAAHVILGLPGEGPEHFRRTACELRKLPLEGVKIHNLHVIRGTPLAEQWKRGEVSVMDEHEYAEVLIDFLRRIPAEWPVMRVMSDADPAVLLAPRWWMSKGQFLAYIERRMTELGVRQGDLAAEAASREPCRPPSG